MNASATGAGSREEPGAGARLFVREARHDDFASILAVARATFTEPRWLFERPGNLRHYRPEWADSQASPAGRYRVTVAADDAGRIVGYCYVRYRADGDVHLKELAANPPEAPSKVRGAGAWLLEEALATEAAAGCSRVVACVIAEHRTRSLPRGSGWRDPLAYYQRLGFSVLPDRSSLGDGYRFRGGDTWIAAPLAAVRAAIGVLTGER